MADASKRDSLKTLAGLLGLGLSATTLDVLADYQPPQDLVTDSPKLFSKAQMRSASALAEVVIPTTDTPGAQAVGAHHYLDYHLSRCASKPEQLAITGLLDKLDATALRGHERLFAALNAEQQSALVEKLHAGQAPFTAADADTWSYFISLVVLAYYSSEVGATQELSYLAVPGGYDGDMPFSEVGRAWSLQPFI